MRHMIIEMAPCNLTYIINSLNCGGAQIGMARLLSELSPNRFNMRVVTLKQADIDISSELPDYVNLIEIDAKSKLEMYKLIPLRKIISTSDIVVCSLFHSVIAGSILSRISFDPPNTYCWRHNTKQNTGLRKALYVTSYYLSKGVLVDSKSTKNQLLSWGINNRKISIIPLSGIKIENYPYVDHSRENKKIRIGTVGRLVQEKGYNELIQCADRLSKYEFHIVGDGPLKKELQQSSSNIIWHGHMNQKELHQTRKSFDIYFQPSRSEGLCITAIEAMASGIPVVASNVGGLTESIVDNETGYLVEQGDISTYCSRIKKLAAEPELRSEFGKKGRNRVVKKYSSEALANQFQKVAFE